MTRARIEWLSGLSIFEGKTKEEIKQNIIDMCKEDSFCIKNGLTVFEWQFNELIPEYIEK